MSTYKINGELYKNLVTNGAAWLFANYKYVDSLNVFPVPDGDTGTNMRMTIEAGVNTVRNETDTNIGEMSKKFSKGMLMGARGNSGVILSQIFRGIAKGFTDIQEASVKDFAKAFQSGVVQAYHSVLKPVEGTILTVVREASEKAVKSIKAKDSLENFFDIFLAEGKASLDRTPNLLPVLKEAGVVDSGGAGLIFVIEGMQKYLNGEEIKPAEGQVIQPQQVINTASFNAHSTLEYGYCTEFILQLQYSKVDIVNFDVKTISDWLETIGNSIVALKDEDIVKVHVHTMDPGLVLSHCRQYGEYLTLKIENMQVSHTEAGIVDPNSENGKQADPALCNCPQCVEMRKNAERKEYAVVAVASGDGLCKCFRDLGADYIVSGGQSMNPSAEDFTKGFDQLNAANILVFPNNSNIVLTAQQAAKYYKGDANIIVVPCKTLAQGYSALAMLDTTKGSTEAILDDLKDIISNVTTGLITYSIRDTEFEGIKMHKNDFIGICNGQIIVSNAERIQAVKGLISKSDINEKEMLTIIYGEGVTKEEVASIEEYVQTNYSHVEIEIINGGQQVYSYIFSIE